MILAVGARSEGAGLRYPVNDVAARYGASVGKETSSAKAAYAAFERPQAAPCPPEFPL